MALFHLLVLNFPYALTAWIYLFVFTLVSAFLFPSFFLSASCVKFFVMSVLVSGSFSKAPVDTLNGHVFYRDIGHVLLSRYLKVLHRLIVLKFAPE